MRFSANLGFLWTELALPEAIRAAGAAGFDAVEFHWPYDVPTSEVRKALTDAGLPALGLNTIRGAAGENGLAALPGRETEARAAIDQALAYATDIDAGAVHVMAGFAEGSRARAAFLDNLRYAHDAARGRQTILIEPLNRFDAPGYFLRDTHQALDIIEELDLPGVKLMFDCYHVGRTEGDILLRFDALRPVIGHVQFAGVPERGPPDRGEVDFGAIFAAVDASGWNHPLGAEYRPDGATELSLDWMESLRP